MDIVVASSRGKGLEPLIRKLHPTPETVTVKWFPGGTLEGIQNAGYEEIMRSDDPTNCHVYFFAGINDITYMDKDHKYNKHEIYEELLYKETPTETYNRLTQTIDNITNHTLFLAAKPIFCPILTCSLKTWNFTRCDQHKTSFLIHHKHYDDMQHLMNHAIHQINTYISQTNISNGVVTPFLEDTITTKSRWEPPKIHYSRFSDGIHATESLKEKWAKKIYNAIVANRLTPSYNISLLHDMD